MPRTIDVKPGDILRGEVMRFHLKYRTSLDGGSSRIDMTADVDCNGISIEEVKELMAGQGLIVKSQNNRERKLADLRAHKHFRGDWKEFTKSSGKRMDVASMPADALLAMMTPEQKAELIKSINRQIAEGANMGAAINEALDAVRDAEASEDEE